MLEIIIARSVNEKNSDREFDAAIAGRKITLPRMGMEDKKEPVETELSAEDEEKARQLLQQGLQKMRLKYGK